MNARRNTRVRRFLVTAVAAAVVIGAACPAFSQSRELIKTDDLTVTWGGYIKSLATLSVDGKNRNWDGSLRLRIKTEANYRDFLTLTLHYEIASIFGESFANPAYRRIALRDPDVFANLTWRIADGSNYLVTHTLDRAYLTIRAKSLTFLVGRQRIAWGTARFVSPLDLFNPFDPTALDKEEKRGTDAFVTEVALGRFTGMSLVFAPELSLDNSSYAARFYTNLFDYDLAVIAGRFTDREVYGMDFSGQIWDVAVWGEAAWYSQDDATTYVVADPASPFGFSVRRSPREYLRASLGAQYVFPNTLSILVEYYYNGKGERNKDNYNWEAAADGTEPALARNYLFSTVSYEITPLLVGTFSVIHNVDDGSVLVAPSVDYSLTESLYLTLGAQVGLGQGETEYGQRPEVYYFQVRYYF